MLERASKNNAQFQSRLEGQDLTLEIGCEGGHARHFIIANQTVMSYPGKATAPVFLTRAHEPTLAITFGSAAIGYQALTAKDKQLALIGGIQDKRILIEGNPLYLFWFQGLLKTLSLKT
ncbi:MAG: helicase [Pseudomonadota bacterium]